MKPRAAVIVFPGTNCEVETIAALTKSGFSVTSLLWHEVKSLARYNAVVLPGGFSFEDRGRAGLIASRHAVSAQLKKAAMRGTVMLGICNGAQILVELGLVPGTSNSTISLSRNISSRFISHTCHVVSPLSRGHNAFNDFSEKVLTMPLAHGEGRFTMPATLSETLLKNNQHAFCYCSPSGAITAKANPNGSMLNLAGVTNPSGTVMAFMPHPERQELKHPIFVSMKKWIAAGRRVPACCITAPKLSVQRTESIPTDIELFIQLTITDNPLLSVESAMKDAGYSARLSRFRYMRLTGSLKECAQRIAKGYYANPFKERIFAKKGRQFFEYAVGRGFYRTSFTLPRYRTLVMDSPRSSTAVLWASTDAAFKKAEEKSFFYNPAGQYVHTV